MSNRDKLKIALAGLSNHNSGISDAFKTVEKEMQRVADKIREEAQSKTLDDVKKMTSGFREQIKQGLDSLTTAFDNLKNELGDSEKQLISSLETKLGVLRMAVAESKTAYGTKYNILSEEIDSLKKDIKEISQRKLQIPDFTSQINSLEKELRKEIDLLKADESKEPNDFEDKLKDFEKQLSEIRSRTLSALANHGGQANRNMLVNGNPSTLNRYTDLNIKSGSNVTLTYTNNDTLKTTDLTIASSGGGSNLITTTDIWVDANRVDSYTASGTIQFPYKTITAAISAINTLAPAAYIIRLAAATYVETITLPAIPGVLYGNGATIVGNVTDAKAFDFYDINIIGNVVQSDTSTTTAHQFQSSFVQGNITVSGLAIFIGMSTDTSGIITINTGGVGSFNGNSLGSRIVNSGTLYLNNTSITRTDNANYLVDSSAAGSIAYITGCKLVNNGTGGGVNLSNTASTTQPNEISTIDITLGGTTNGITCGSANCILSDYNIFGSSGQIYATGSAFLPSARNGGIALAGTTSGRIFLQTPSVAGTTLFVLPSSGGSNGQFLKTDGAGITSWAGAGITRITSVISVSSTLAATTLTDYAFFLNIGINVTLPTAIGNSNRYTIKNTSSSSILISTTAGELIDGSSTALLPVQNQSLDIMSNSSVWSVV